MSASPINNSGFKNINSGQLEQNAAGMVPEPQMQQFKESIKRHEEARTLTKILADVATELRILEDRYANLRKKNQLTDQALLETQKNFYKEKKILSEELTEAKMKLQDLEEDIVLMKSEFKDVVKQKDFKVLEKYLDMWEPMEFVTRKEAEDLLDELEQKLHEKKLNKKQDRVGIKGVKINKNNKSNEKSVNHIRPPPVTKKR